MYGHHLLYSRVIWINRVRLPNLLVASSTEKSSVLADTSVVGTYRCIGTLLLLFVFVEDAIESREHICGICNVRRKSVTSSIQVRCCWRPIV